MGGGGDEWELGDRFDGSMRDGVDICAGDGHVGLRICWSSSGHG